MATQNSSTARSTEQWWDWHDLDSSRWSSSMEEAEARAAAWVAGDSGDGPDVQIKCASCGDLTNTYPPSVLPDALVQCIACVDSSATHPCQHATPHVDCQCTVHA